MKSVIIFVGAKIIWSVENFIRFGCVKLLNIIYICKIELI